ncbi:MAG TPA: sigma-70 family RNA polymerase sigma factor [Candidatus Acidoferrum sp.]
MILKMSSFNPMRDGIHEKLPVQQQSDAHLLEQARRGRAQAFDSLCEGHTARLFKVALRITRNREDAEDAVQDSLMRAFSNIKDFQGRSSFFTWLTRIVINSALMIRRKNANTREVSADEPLPSGEASLHLEIPDPAPNPEQSYVEREGKTILRKAIARLRPRLRAVVEIGQLQELSIKETARILDISVAAAKGRFFHGRAVLRRSAALRAVVLSRTNPAA